LFEREKVEWKGGVWRMVRVMSEGLGKPIKEKKRKEVLLYCMILIVDVS
jgi:hypothetical protein